MAAIFNTPVAAVLLAVGRLLVVDRDDPGRLVGYLGRPGILEARMHSLDEEHIRESGLLSRR
jgi:chloride channel protein, CIC family